MALNQMNEEFNDAFETYFPRLKGGRRIGYNISTSLILRLIRLQRRFLGGRRLVNERVIEYPYIFQRLKPNSVVLDIGCTSSRLPIQLASLGHEVHALDLLEYPFVHPNFHFHKANLFEWKPDRQFDSIILLSVIEHFGLGIYGDAKMAGDKDKEAIERITSWLKPHGQLLVTTTYGKPCITHKHRIYDKARLDYIFPASVFKRVDERYHQRINGHWAPSTSLALRDIDSSSLPANGSIVLDMEKI
ncbi:MAG: class I SAM-dependent methyltransferase [Patescibacteria group bacterium]